MNLIKKYGVWIALALTLAAALWLFINDELGVQATMRSEVVLTSNHRVKPSAAGIRAQPDVKPQNASQATSTQAVLMPRPINLDEPQNLFTAFIAVANAAETNAEVLAAQQPTNPFTYAGKLVENGNAMVFLMEGDKNYAVKSGDVIEDLWQVTAIAPPIMKLKHIPSRVEIQLQIGASS